MNHDISMFIILKYKSINKYDYAIKNIEVQTESQKPLHRP